MSVYLYIHTCTCNSSVCLDNHTLGSTVYLNDPGSFGQFQHFENTRLNAQRAKKNTTAQLSERLFVTKMFPAIFSELARSTEFKLPHSILC